MLIFSNLFVIGAVVVLIILLNVSESEQERARLLREEGIDTDAVVTRLWRGSGDSKPPMVAYTFAVQGRPYSSQARVRLSTWEGLDVGSSFPVRFAARNPEINVPAGLQRSPLPLWVGPLVAAAFVALGLLILLPIRSQRHLLTEGRASTGTVTKHTKAGKGGTMIHFEFLLLSGSKATGHSGPTKKPAPVGSEVWILYDPENPRRHAVYPLELVRLA